MLPPRKGSYLPRRNDSESSRQLSCDSPKSVWDEQFQRSGQRYKRPRMVLFSNQVRTGCGVAPSAVGPFYCPADQTVYLDPTFFEELDRKLGGSKADFSQAYVIAHEIGHHVQNLLGYSELSRRNDKYCRKIEFNEWSVRLELQADYLAGVWAHYGQQKFNFIEPGDVEAAISSANAIGDDRLQKRSSGFTSPKNTHMDIAATRKVVQKRLGVGRPEQAQRNLRNAIRRSLRLSIESTAA